MPGGGDLAGGGGGGGNKSTVELARSCTSNRGCIQFRTALTALSLSPARDHVVTVGRSLIRLVKLDLEYETLQEIIVPRTGRKNLTASSTAVDWHPNHFNIIATAATNGAVVLWNLDRVGQETIKQAEYRHTRAANAVHWHPDGQAHSNWLLSCSRQSVVKLWDTRVPPNSSRAPTEPAVGAANGASPSTSSSNFSVGGPCLDVRFSHHSPMLFAAALQDSEVQIWDVRHNNGPVLRYRNLHNSRVYCVRWHPSISGQFATCSRDQSIKVWNVSQPKREVASLATANSVHTIAWRGGRFANQLVSSSMVLDHKIKIWDTRQKFFPLASVDGHTNTVKDLAFVHKEGVSRVPSASTSSLAAASAQESSGSGTSARGSRAGKPSLSAQASQAVRSHGHPKEQHERRHRGTGIGDYLLVSCSSDGTLQLHDIRHAEQPILDTCNAALSLSARGDVAFCHDPIDRRWRGHLDAIVTDPQPQANIVVTQRAEEEFVDRCAFGIAPPVFSAPNHVPHHAPAHPQQALQQRKTQPTKNSSHHLAHHRNTNHQQQGQHSALPPRVSQHVQHLWGDDTAQYSSTYGPTGSRMSTDGPLVIVRPPLQENRDFDGEEELFDHACFEFLAENYRLCPEWGVKCQPSAEPTGHTAASASANTASGQRINLPQKNGPAGVDIIYELCRHNVKVAETAELPVQASTWQTLACLFEPTLDDESVGAASDTAPSSDLPHGGRPANSTLLSSDGGTAGASPGAKSGEGVSKGATIPASSSRSRRVAAAVQQETVRSIVEHYGARGHCQMVVTMLCVLRSGGWDGGRVGSLLEGNSDDGDSEDSDSFSENELGNVNDRIHHQVRGEEYDADSHDASAEDFGAESGGSRVNHRQNKHLRGKSDVVRHRHRKRRQRIDKLAWLDPVRRMTWFRSYIDLLHSLKLFPVAAQVIKLSPDPKVRQLTNSKACLIHLYCSRPGCRKALSSTGISSADRAGRCPECSKVNSTCGVCELPVKGIFAWCQGCGHGGHIDHLRDWFSDNVYCPVGCNHMCDLSALRTHQLRIDEAVTMHKVPQPLLSDDR